MTAPDAHETTVADRYPLLVAGLSAAVATVGATIFAIAPLLTDIAASFEVTPASAGRLIGIYGLAMAIVAPTVGLLAQRLPRVRVIVAGLLLFALAWLLVGMTRRFEVLLALTLVAGAATGAVIPAAYAYAGDLSSFAQRGKVMGWVVSGWSIAILFIVPLMSIASQAIGWQLTFAGLAVAALASAALLAFASRSGPASGAAGSHAPAWPVGPSLRRIAWHRPTVVLLAVNAVDMGAVYAVYAFLGNEIRRLNDWSAGPAGLALAAYGVGLLVATLNGRIVDRVGKTRSAVGALVFVGLLLTALPWLAGRPLLLVPSVVAWGCAQGIFFTGITSLVTEQIPELRGVVTAMLSGSSYLGVTVFSPPAVALYEGSGFAMVGLGAAFACLAAAALLAWPGAGVAAFERERA